MSTPLWSWLSKAGPVSRARRCRAPRPGRPAGPPRLEALEDRSLLSVSSVGIDSLYSPDPHGTTSEAAAVLPPQDSAPPDALPSVSSVGIDPHASLPSVLPPQDSAPPAGDVT